MIELDDYTEEDYLAEMESMREEERQLRVKDERCLKRQQKRLPKIRYEELTYLLYLFENCENYEVVRVCGGTKEKQPRCRYHYFIDGSCTQDISGEYSGCGTIWYPIGNGNYFKFDYWG